MLCQAHFLDVIASVLGKDIVGDWKSLLFKGGNWGLMRADGLWKVAAGFVGFRPVMLFSGLVNHCLFFLSAFSLQLLEEILFSPLKQKISIWLIVYSYKLSGWKQWRDVCVCICAYVCACFCVDVYFLCKWVDCVCVCVCAYVCLWWTLSVRVCIGCVHVCVLCRCVYNLWVCNICDCVCLFYDPILAVS